MYIFGGFLNSKFGRRGHPRARKARGQTRHKNQKNNISLFSVGIKLEYGSYGECNIMILMRIVVIVLMIIK